MIGSADEGKADVVKLLLDRGANKEAVNNVSVVYRTVTSVLCFHAFMLASD